MLQKVRLALLLRQQPYIYAVHSVHSDGSQSVWGVFTSQEKAEEAIAKWQLEEYGLEWIIAQYIIDYRNLIAPPKYWSPNDNFGQAGRGSEAGRSG